MRKKSKRAKKERNNGKNKKDTFLRTKAFRGN